MSRPSPTDAIELCILIEEKLEVVAARLDAAGYAHEQIVDENFGRSLRTTDPDGLPIQINEHDPTLYT